jgi:hypothetical protein
MLNVGSFAVVALTMGSLLSLVPALAAAPALIFRAIYCPHLNPIERL